MNPEKPGYKTTEFYVALVAQLVPIAVVVGILTAEQADVIVSSFTNLVAVAAVFVAAVWPVVEYIKARAKVKAAALEAQKPDAVSTAKSTK